MQNGFVIIPRAVEKFEVLQDMDALGFYTMLMLSLRFRETYVDGIEVGVNQLLISKPELARRCNLTLAKVRRLLQCFQAVGGIRCENIKNKYTRITFLEDFIYTNKGDTGGKSNPPAAAVQTDECVDIVENAPEKSQNEKPGNPTKYERGELKVFGKYDNVFLTDEEYRDLKNDYPFADGVINKFSAFILNNPKKSENNHHAQLFRWLINEKDKQTAEASLSACGSFGKPVCTPDPNASYDLARAEQWARTHTPVFKKRER